MKKFLTLFICLFFVSLYMTVSAQQKIFVWKDGGIRNIINSEEIDSVSFSVGPWLFEISTLEATAVTTQSFSVIPKVTLSKNIKYIQEYYQCGVCYSQSNHVPTIADVCLNTRYYEENVSVTAEKLIPNTTYYYRTYVKFLDKVYYGDVMSVTTLEGDRPEPKIINEHSFVDLGLPSGLLWADRNVGASSPLNGGDYFAWGETEPKETYSEANYKWWNGSFTKYNSFDQKLILEAEDDAASVNWGKECRTPSIADFRELVKVCTWEWLYSDNFPRPIYRVFGPNGNYIDLYCNGWRKDEGIAFYAMGYYMANSICENKLNDNKLDYTTTNYLFLNGGIEVSTYGMGTRIGGTSVRPVANR